MRQKLIAFASTISILGGLLLSFGYAHAAASVSTPATANVSSDSLTGSSVALPNIVVTEGAIADIATGLHTWTAPTGYTFDTSSVANVVYTGTTLAGTAVVSFPDNTHFTVNITAASTATGTMTIGSVTALKAKVVNGAPMAAAGNINMTGGTIAGVSGSTNFGTLTQVVGAASKLAITTQPVSSVPSGNTFSLTATIQDQFGNTRTSDTSSIVLSALYSNSLSAAGGTLGGTLTQAATAGVDAFTGLTYSGVDNITIKAHSGSLTDAFTNNVQVTGTSQGVSSATPPTSAITAPAAGTTVTPGQSVTVTGTTTQGSTSSIQMIQLSFDGGVTWVNAAGVNGSFGTWTYTWTVPTSATGTVTIKSMATDWLGKTETPSAGVAIKIASATSATPNPAPAPSPTPAATPTPSTTPTPTPGSPTPTPYMNLTPWTDGSVVVFNGSPTVYMVSQGMLMPFTSETVFKARGYSFAQVKAVPGSAVNYSVSIAVIYPDGTLIKGSSPVVYLITNKGTKAAFSSYAAFKKMKLSLRDVKVVSDNDLSLYAQGVTY